MLVRTKQRLWEPAEGDGSPEIATRLGKLALMVLKALRCVEIQELRLDRDFDCGVS